MNRKHGSAKIKARLRRKAHVRKCVRGTSDRPRLNVYRSNKHIYAQVIDDVLGTTLVAVSSRSKALAKAVDGKTKKEAAKAVGEALAKQCGEKDIKKVVFDRNGFLYWGRLAAVADGAREGGLDL